MSRNFVIPEGMIDHVDQYVGRVYRDESWYHRYRKCYSDPVAAARVLTRHLSDCQKKKINASIRSKRRNRRRQTEAASLGLNNLSLKQRKIIQEILSSVPEGSFGGFVDAYLEPLVELKPEVRTSHLQMLKSSKIRKNLAVEGMTARS